MEELVENGEAFPVMEHFYTIQGEGSQNGRPAYFVRLAGCDVGCVWCDVKESWKTAGFPVLTIEKIVELVEASNAQFCVITGGEPAMYNLNLLTDLLISKGIETAIETSGAHPVSGTWDVVCFSPKKFKEPAGMIYDIATELKVVVFNKHDLQWAKKHADLVNKDCVLYLQPEWGKKDQMLPLVIDFVKENQNWRISLQTHKFMDIP